MGRRHHPCPPGLEVAPQREGGRWHQHVGVAPLRAAATDPCPALIDGLGEGSGGSWGSGRLCPGWAPPERLVMAELGGRAAGASAALSSLVALPAPQLLLSLPPVSLNCVPVDFVPCEVSVRIPQHHLQVPDGLRSCVHASGDPPSGAHSPNPSVSHFWDFTFFLLIRTCSCL